MTGERRGWFVVLAASLLFVPARMTWAQKADEAGTVVAEDLLVEEALTGGAKKTLDKAPEKAPAAGTELPVEKVAEPTVAVPAPEPVAPAPAATVVAEPAVPVEVVPPAVVKPAEGTAPALEEGTVEQIAREALKPKPAEAGAVAEPPKVEQVAEEVKPVAKPPDELEKILAVEPPVAPVVEQPVTPPKPKEVVGEEALLVEPEPKKEVKPVAVEAVAPPVIEAPAKPEAVVPSAVEVKPPVVEAQPPAVVPAALTDAEDRDVVEQERLRLQALRLHAQDLMQQAMTESRDGKYEHSAQLYLEAFKYLRGPGGDALRKQAQKELADNYYRWATSLKSQNKLTEAMSVAEKAQNYQHPRARKLVDEISWEIDHPRKAEIAPQPVRWKQKDYADQQKLISDMLQKSKEYYAAGEYGRARETLELVVKQDPTNTEAFRLMNKVAIKQHDAARTELEATRETMIKDVTATWNPRDYGIPKKPRKDQLKPAATKAPSKEDSDRLKTIAKMETIKIPEINFQQAFIQDVISFLQEQSVRNDPSKDESEPKGVNIILHLRKSGAPAGGEPKGAEPVVDVFKIEGGGKEGAGGGGDTITFSARYISLKDALKIVTDLVGLKYRVEGRVVMILPLDAADGDIINRMYDVLPTLLERINQVKTQLPRSGGGGGAGGFTAMDPNAVTSELADMKEFFGQLGMKWPAGSSIKYLPAIGKLFVSNTAENLTEFDKILGYLNVVPYQIEIEARFVEVAQTDLSALGFEWLLNDDWEIAENKSDSSLPLAARRRIDMKATTITKGNRFIRDFAASGGATISDDLLNVGAILTNPELRMVLHALDQSGHADLLSAPKVTTRAGNEATIKVVTEYIYPTEFQVSGISGATTTVGGGVNPNTVGAVVEPGNFETREVGVILTVMPEVSPEGQLINLTMSPQVVSEPEWKNYGSKYTTFDPNGNPVVQELNMPQPFFHTREVVTSISIYNGATVVMGGMINEIRRDVDDKVPVLGEIPVIGRLFRSKHQQTEKRNLLIFVTARLVDPGGVPVGPRDEMSVDAFTQGPPPANP